MTSINLELIEQYGEYHTISNVIDKFNILLSSIGANKIPDRLFYSIGEVSEVLTRITYEYTGSYVVGFFDPNKQLRFDYILNSTEDGSDSIWLDINTTGTIGEYNAVGLDLQLMLSQDTFRIHMVVPNSIKNTDQDFFDDILTAIWQLNIPKFRNDLLSYLRRVGYDTNRLRFIN